MMDSDAFSTLKSEFPELSEDQIQQALQEANYDINVARSIIQKKHYREEDAAFRTEDNWSWSNIFNGVENGIVRTHLWSNPKAIKTTLPPVPESHNQHMFVLVFVLQSLRAVQEGFNSLSATMSLGARSVVHTLNTILPPEINPFIEEYADEYDEEELEAKLAR